MRFLGKVVVITGASGGIGEATAKRITDEGGRLALLGRDPDRTHAVAERTGAFYVSTADITLPSACKTVIREIHRMGEGLDVLINNAGAIVRADTCDTTSEQWRSIMSVNLDAAFFLSREAVDVMREKGVAGAVVNVASINSFVGRKGLVAYSSSKGALIQMTQSMALDCAGDNIRVNAVCPGATDTPMPFSGHANTPKREEVERLLNRDIPMGRMADPAEVAAAVAFLASSDASYITGTSLMVDGGFTSR